MTKKRKYIFTLESVQSPITEKVIYEITWGDYKKIDKVLKGVDGKKLSFDELFDGDKKRIMLPLKGSKKKSQIQHLIDFFEKNGYDLDFSTGLATKTIEIPEGPKKGQKREKTTRIGKLLQNLANQHSAYQKEEDEERAKQIFGKIEKSFPDPRAEGFDEDPEGKSLAWYEAAKNMLDFWNKKSEFYRKNPKDVGKEEEKYSIIVSRHPVDVLRMSDFSNIRSCHSPDSSYFQCAVAEAQGHGLVAYAVENEELPDNFDVNKDEIFSDAKRDISGVTPVSRLRLRKYTVDDKYEIAVPETRVYGKRIPGFRQAILSWAQESQKEIQNAVKEKELPDMDDFLRHGGSYSDSTDSELLNAIYGTDQYNGNTDTVSEEEDTEAEMIEQCEQVMRNYDFDHSYISYDVDDENVIYHGGMSITFSNLEFIKDISNDSTIENEVSRDLQRVLEEDTYAIENVSLQFRNDDGLIIYIDASVEYDFTPDGFDDFANMVKDELDDNYNRLRFISEECLVDNNIMKPSKFFKFKKEAQESKNLGQNIFKNFKEEIEEGEIEFSNDGNMLFDPKGYDEEFPKEFTQALRNTSALFQELLENKVQNYKKDAKKQLSLPGLEELPEKFKFLPIEKLSIRIHFNTNKFSTYYYKKPIPEGLGIALIKISVFYERNQDKLYSTMAYLDFMDNNYDLVATLVQQAFDETIKQLGLKHGKKTAHLDITSEFKKITNPALMTIPPYEKIDIIYFDFGNTIFVHDIEGNLVKEIRDNNDWEISETNVQYVFLRKALKALLIELKKYLQQHHKEAKYVIFGINDLVFKILNRSGKFDPFESALEDIGLTPRDMDVDYKNLEDRYPEMGDFLKYRQNICVIKLDDLKENRNIKEKLNSLVDENVLAQGLFKNRKALGLALAIKPLDLVKLIAKDCLLPPKDALKVTLGLISKAKKEGLKYPSIETNKQFPVPAVLRKGKKVELDAEAFARPQGKVDITPKFTFSRYHFPPDPSEKNKDWPYDDMTVSLMKPKAKSKKRSLTMSKDKKRDGPKAYLFKDPLQQNLGVNQPGGDGAGGGGLCQKHASSKDNSMSTAGNRTWTKRGVAGWSSSLRDKEYDPPWKEEKKEPDCGDEPNFMKPAPVGSSIPSVNFGGRDDGSKVRGGRKGFRRR